MRSLLIVMALILAPQARAELPPDGDVPAGTPKAKWVAPQPEQAKEINARSQQPAKVRIGLRLTPFKRVVTRNRDGSTDQRFVPIEPLRHTLRARLNKTNHFFVGEWHVESVPTKWIKKTRHYEVKLNIYRRYGAFGQLEENVGSIQLAGTLEEERDNVHVLLGTARKRLRDKAGQPYLDVVAGFAPGAEQGPAVSLSGPERQTVKPPVAPDGAPGEILRGRF
jgi:hypothetical protein